MLLSQELSTGILNMAGDLTSPARFCMDTDRRLKSPQFLSNHLKRTTSLYTGADGELRKNTAVEGCAASSPARWTSCTKDHSIFQKDYDLRTQNSAERGSLPRYVQPTLHGSPLLPAPRRTLENTHTHTCRMSKNKNHKHAAMFWDTIYDCDHFHFVF